MDERVGILRGRTTSDNATRVFQLRAARVARFVRFSFRNSAPRRVHVSHVQFNPGGIWSPGSIREYPALPAPQPVDGSVRLSEGAHGRVELYSDSGGWGTVCHKAAWNKDRVAMLALATVVCRELGYDPQHSDFLDDTESLPFRGDTNPDQPIFSTSVLSQVCRGDENRLSDCGQRAREGEDDFAESGEPLVAGGNPDCNHNHDVAVSCAYKPRQQTTGDYCSNSDLTDEAACTQRNVWTPAIETAYCSVSATDLPSVGADTGCIRVYRTVSAGSQSLLNKQRRFQPWFQLAMRPASSLVSGPRKGAPHASTVNTDVRSAARGSVPHAIWVKSPPERRAL